MIDRSDAVAPEILVGPGESPDALHFRRRVRWHVVGGCGSWAAVILIPMANLLTEGELPAVRGLVVIVPFVVIGFALIAFAAREFVDRTTLCVADGELRLERGPIVRWPRRAIPIASIVAARVEIHPDSLRYPARYRGSPMARPYRVVLERAGRESEVLPILLGQRDAGEVGRFVERVVRRGA